MPGRKQDEQENGDCISTDEYDGSDVRHGHVRHDFLRGKNCRTESFLYGL